MNTLMYEHPLTAEHLRIVREVVGYEVVGPIGKKLACGDVGEWFVFARCTLFVWRFSAACARGWVRLTADLQEWAR